MELNDSALWSRKLHRETVQLWRQVRDRKRRAVKRKIRRIVTMIENEVARGFSPVSNVVNPLEVARQATVDDSDADEPDTLGWYAHMHAAIREVGDHVKTDWREAERRAIAAIMLIERAIIYHVSESLALLGDEFWQEMLDELEHGSIAVPPSA